MPARSTVTSIDEYIAQFPPEVGRLLQELRLFIAGAAPGATETMSYAIPTFDLNGTHLVHFAGYTGHIGFYPTGSGVEAFRGELAAYRGGRGTIRFPIGEPLPWDLIRRIVEFRVRAVAARKPGSLPRPGRRA
jgi:uncharacterized protein YdhG (YjbR/CyaY superfamily)